MPNQTARMLCSTAGLTQGNYVTVLDRIGDTVNVEDLDRQIHTVMIGDLQLMEDDDEEIPAIVAPTGTNGWCTAEQRWTMFDGETCLSCGGTW